MDNQPQFIALRCETCGGKLDVPKQNVAGEGDDGFTITGYDVFTCQHCGTEFLPQQSLKRFASDSGNTILGDVVGGDVIYGDKVGGNVIHGDKVVFQHVKLSQAIEASAQQQKISKKWWQFWK